MDLVRVLLVDANARALERARDWLEERGLEVVAEASSATGALDVGRDVEPDLLIVNSDVLRRDGPEPLHILQDEQPDLGIIVWTLPDDACCEEPLEHVARLSLVRLLHVQELIDFLEGNRRMPLDSSWARLLDPLAEESPSEECIRLQSLSPRQQEILIRVAQGQTYRQVARALSVTERTIKYHMSQAVQKLCVDNRAQAIALAVRCGLLDENGQKPGVDSA